MLLYSLAFVGIAILVALAILGLFEVAEKGLQKLDARRDRKGAE